MNNLENLNADRATLNYLILIISFVLFIGGCGGGDDMSARYKAEELLTRADRLKEQILIGDTGYSDDDFRRLKDAYQRASNSVDLPENPDDVQVVSDEIRRAWAVALLANTRIASLHMERREYDSAFVYYQMVASSPAADHLQRNVILRHMAYVKEKSGEYNEAADLYDKVAIGYLKLLNPDRPEMDAIAAPLSKAEMYRNTGESQRFREELENARSYYRKIIENHPGSSAAEISLGKIAASFMLQGRYDEALDILKSSGRDDKNRLKPRTLLVISEIYLDKLKEYNNAEKYYREFLRLYPDHPDKPEAMLGLGLSLYERDRYKKARGAVEDIEKASGASEQNVAQAYNLIALCYEAEGNWQLAEGQLEFIKATFPGNKVAYEAALYIVSHYRNHGNKSVVDREFNEAVEYINKYVELSSQNPGAAAQALGYLARAYIENGDIETAIRQLEKLHYNYPETPEGMLASLKIADLYENELNNKEKSIMWLESHIEKNRSSASVAKLKEHIEELKSGG